MTISQGLFKVCLNDGGKKKYQFNLDGIWSTSFWGWSSITPRTKLQSRKDISIEKNISPLSYDS